MQHVSFLAMTERTRIIHFSVMPSPVFNCLHLQDSMCYHIRQINPNLLCYNCSGLTHKDKLNEASFFLYDFEATSKLHYPAKQDKLFFQNICPIHVRVSQKLESDVQGG